MEIIIDNYLKAMTQITLEDKMEIDNDRLLYFEAKDPPKISMRDYVNRMVMYIDDLDQNVLVGGLIFLEKFIASTGKNITMFNIHRIYAISVLLSIKILIDIHLTNTSFGLVAGLSLKDVNNLEEEFIKLIDFDLVLRPVDIYQKLAILHLPQRI